MCSSDLFDDCIGVVDAVNPPKAYGCDWSRYAQLGVKAIIVSPRSGLNDLTAERWATLNPQMVGNDPINYVRLLGNAAVYRYLDQPVTLHVRTEFRSYPNRTIIGILKSGRPNRDAVVVTAPYDAYSYLPDLAPGVATAYEIAELLRVLEGQIGRAHV